MLRTVCLHICRVDARLTARQVIGLLKIARSFRQPTEILTSRFV